MAGRRENRRNSKKEWLLLGAAALALVLGLALRGRGDPAAFLSRAEPLREAAMADWLKPELGNAPAGEAGYAVLFSVCDGEGRTPELIAAR